MPARRIQPIKVSPCITANCKEPAETRGLCRRCYNKIRGLLARGAFSSWDDIVQKGRALPLVVPNRKPNPPRAPRSYHNPESEGMTDEELAQRIEEAHRQRWERIRKGGL